MAALEVSVCFSSSVHSWVQRIFCPIKSIKTNLVNRTRGKVSTKASGRSRTTPESSSPVIGSVGSVLSVTERKAVDYQAALIFTKTGM